MNAWDLSCRPKLPSVSDGRSPESSSQSLASNSSSSSSNSPCSSSSSPASSRSNSIAASDEIPQLAGCGLSRASLTATAPIAAETTITMIGDHHNQPATSANQHQLTTAAIVDDTNQQHHNHHHHHHPPQHMQLADRKARKKDQNRRAAYNYRRKKMEEKNRIREEEMRLVYSRVCLIGYADELESSIMYILNTRSSKILDKTGSALAFICPVCMQSCDSLLNLRSHLNVVHFN